DPGPRWNVRVRRAAREAIARTLPPTSAALLSGLLLGDRADLPPEVEDGFRRAGVYHVLAVSGFNVALIAGAVFSVLTLARCGRRVAAVAAIAAVLGFAFVVGPEPSVLRAAVMGVRVLGAVHEPAHHDPAPGRGLWADDERDAEHGVGRAHVRTPVTTAPRSTP